MIVATLLLGVYTFQPLTLFYLQEYLPSTFDNSVFWTLRRGAFLFLSACPHDNRIFQQDDNDCDYGSLVVMRHFVLLVVPLRV